MKLHANVRRRCRLCHALYWSPPADDQYVCYDCQPLLEAQRRERGARFVEDPRGFEFELRVGPFDSRYVRIRFAENDWEEFDQSEHVYASALRAVGGSLEQG